MTKTSIFNIEHFEVRESTIDQAGQGLFATVSLLPNDTVGEYTGIIVSDSEVEKPPYCDSHYILSVCANCNIVGEGPLSNHTRYINHHDNPNSEIISSTRWKKARIRAIKPIKKGDEILIDYGESYWSYE